MGNSLEICYYDAWPFEMFTGHYTWLINVDGEKCPEVSAYVL
jgi:hypothetical protein